MSNPVGFASQARGKRLIGFALALSMVLTTVMPVGLLRAQEKKEDSANMPKEAVGSKSPEKDDAKAAPRAAAPQTRPASANDPVDVAIRRAVAFLYSQQKNGNWEEAPRRQGEGAADTAGAQWGGVTAMVTYALLAAGESPQDPRMAQAINWLMKNEIIGTYAMGMKLQIWNYMEHLNAEQKQVLRKDATLLMNGVKVTGVRPGDEMYGMFHYFLDPTKGSYDHSTSNYGVLGMWAAAQRNLEVPTEFWRVVDAAWRRNQHKEGSWSYHKKPGPGHEATVSMTAAGVATLFITQDYITQSKQQEEGWDCRGNIADDNIDRGIKWLSTHYKDVFKESWKMYALYNVERVGTASGLKYFGNVDWYKDGAAHLLQTQNKADGSWEGNRGKLVNTVFGILFLVKARAPIMFNKLEYAMTGVGEKAPPANWNQRPRDVANLTRWTGKMLEKELNWQIVNLKAPMEDLHDSAVLYISGNQALNLSKEDKEKLKLYIEQGGLVLGHADCNDAKFATSFMKLGQELFKGLEFRELPSDHPIYTCHFHRKNWKQVPPGLKGLSNGAREFMVLIPAGDPARFWQVQNFAASHTEAMAQLATNIFLYAIDKQTLQGKFKGHGHVVRRNERIKDAASVKVARLEYAGNWNPEPAGWKRLSDLMHNTYGVALESEVVKLGEGKLKADQYKLAHLTGTSKFLLTPPQQKELKQFVEGGGTLVIDAAGGVVDFKESAEAQLAEVFAAKGIPPLKPDHPVYSAGDLKIDRVDYRAWAKRLLVSNMATPRLRGVDVGGRTAIFYSPEDLSVGLVGMPIDGIYGYEPEAATRLMRNVVVYAMGGKLPPPPAAPEAPKEQPREQPKPAEKKDPAEKKEMKEGEKEKPAAPKADPKKDASPEAKKDAEKKEAERKDAPRKLKDR